MDIQSIISSGILENYALGHCSESEKAEVERLLAKYPALRTELDAIEKALEAYASAHTAPPPDWLKGRILDVIGNDIPVRPAVPRQLKMFRLVAASLTLCLMAVAYGLWVTGNQTRQLHAELAQTRQILKNCDREALRSDTLQQQIAFFRHHATHPVAISGPAGTAYFFQNHQTGLVYLDISTLPQPPTNKYYQCWGIVNKVPVSLGMVDWQAAQGLQQLGTVQNATAFAISLEDRPEGNPQPTAVHLIGNAG